MIQIAPSSSDTMSYDEALLYCQFLEYDGHRDWRMPTMDEWTKSDDIKLMSWWIRDPDTIEDGIWLTVEPVRDVCLQ